MPVVGARDPALFPRAHPRPADGALVVTACKLRTYGYGVVLMLATACAENPTKYVDTADPDSLASYLVGICGIADDGAIATAEALEKAGQDAAALAVADARDLAVPYCRTVHDAQVAYRVAVALGEDPTVAKTRLNAANTQAQGPVTALNAKIGGKK